MPVNSKTFSQLVTFSRASGATRVNAAGLIVGVDFSATSNTIGTGSKTFTLTADANVNRDWPASSAIRAVDQVGGGTMIGTVTSYNASTQELVINVASITGSGTSTNWRIGSLEFRRDYDPVTLAPRGGLVEGQATNRYSFSQDISNAAWTKVGATTAGPVVSPDGSANAFTLVEDTSTGLHAVSRVGLGAVAGEIHHLVFFVQASGRTRLRLVTNFWSAATENIDFNFSTDTVTAASRFTARIEPFGAYKRVFVSSVCDVTGIRETGNNFLLVNDAGLFSYTGDGVSGMRFWGIELRSGSQVSSPIPTTTVAVTRAADLANIDGTRFSGAYNQSQGTIYVEMTPLAAAVQAVAASINDGTLNNAIRIGQKQSGTLSSIRAIASDGVTDVMAVNATTRNALVSNGVDYTETALANATGRFAAASASVGNFIVAGGSDTISSSSNSLATSIERGTPFALGGAHFGIGRFVIAGPAAETPGTGSVIVSSDGITFRRVNIPGLTQNLNEITSNGTNQYVAVGNGGVIYTSPDAETWTAQTSGTTQALRGADYGSIGGTPYYYTAGDGNQSVRRSTDGITWNALTVDNVSYADIAIGNGQIVLCRNGGDGYSSLNGTTFTVNASLGNVAGAVYSAALGLWIAVGPIGRIVTATDPSGTWTARTSGTTQDLNEVQLFGSTIVAVGASQTVLTSTDAVTWTARTANVTSTLSGIATNGSRLLVCGSSGAITTSEDGTTFTSRTGNNAVLNGAAFGNGVYVVVGNAANGSGLIATVDPTTFAYRRITAGLVNANYFDALYAFGRWIAVITNHAATSTDNVTWTSTMITNSGRALRGIGSSGSLVVIVGDSGVFHTTSDGITFSAQSAAGALGTSNQYNSVAFGNGTWVVVGNSGSISTSPNGTTWTARTSGVTSALYAVRWNTRDQCFYAAGDSGVILRSADGITWENIANDAISASIAGGAIQANPTLGNLIPNAINKVAMRYAGNDFAVSVNGADAVADASGSVPAVNRLSLGMSGTGANPFNGYIRKVQYYPVAKSNADLKVLTS